MHNITVKELIRQLKDAEMLILHLKEDIADDIHGERLVEANEKMNKLSAIVNAYNTIQSTYIMIYNNLDDFKEE